MAVTVFSMLPHYRWIYLGVNSALSTTMERATSTFVEVPPVQAAERLHAPPSFPALSLQNAAHGW